MPLHPHFLLAWHPVRPREDYTALRTVWWVFHLWNVGPTCCPGARGGKGLVWVNATPSASVPCLEVLFRGNGMAQGPDKGMVRDASGCWCWESLHFGWDPVLQGNGRMLAAAGGCLKGMWKDTGGSVLVNKCAPLSNNALIHQVQQRSQKWTFFEKP